MQRDIVNYIKFDQTFDLANVCVNVIIEELD